MELRKALKVLGIEEILKDKIKEGSNLVRQGLFECCQELNEAILTVRSYMKEE